MNKENEIRTQAIRLIAEWEPQDAVIISWPHRFGDWRETFSQIESCYREIASAILARQPLIVIAHDQLQADEIKMQLKMCEQQPDIIIAATNDTWIRDYGPLSIEKNGHHSLINFEFNAWGGKYPSELDNLISKKLDESGYFKHMLKHDFVLEGGAVETDGQGTLLATRSSVISESRNPGFTQLQIETLLREQLGVHHFLWLDCPGLSGDDTDGHIDTLARFADKETIVYMTVESTHQDFDTLQELYTQLQELKQPDGRPYRLIGLPPAPCKTSVTDGRALAATYANFLFINGAILMPVYNHPNDALAFDLLHQATSLPVIPVDCNALIEQNGSLHCATIQLAKNTLNQNRQEQ